MFKKPSLINRIIIGKSVGFAIGLIAFFTLPTIMPEAAMRLRLGILFWYTTVGAIIGVFGVFTYHPVLKLPIPWWFRAPLLGAWMNFVLTLFAYDTMQQFIIAFFGQDPVLESPFWFCAEGAIVGLIIGYCATKCGGQGKATLQGDTQ